MLILFLSALIIIPDFSIHPVHAGTINVPGDYPTVQKAINAANVNDTILVAAGIYNELVMLNKTVHLVGAGRDSTILDGQAMGTVVTVTANAASIGGFTIRNAVSDGDAIQLFRVRNVNATGNNLFADLSGSRPTIAGLD